MTLQWIQPIATDGTNRGKPVVAVDRIAVTALGQEEEYIVFSGLADNGELISLNTVQERAYRRDKAPIAINVSGVSRASIAASRRASERGLSPAATRARPMESPVTRWRPT